MQTNKVKISVITSLFNCTRYLECYFAHVKNISNLDEVEILLLHNAPQPDEVEIIQRNLPLIPALKHIIIPHREGLYSTWNRGVRMAQGKYCAVWNVDDIRFPDSLKVQAEILDKYPDVGMSYGNYYSTAKHGDLIGDLIIENDSRVRPFQAKVSHLVGCFPMWRKSIHQELGYFDEQFRLAADYEFQIRVARKYRLCKTETIMGCYLGSEDGRLSNNSTVQQAEVTAIEWRYGIFYKTNLMYLLSALKYRWDEILYGERYIPVKEYLPKVTRERCLRYPTLIIPVLVFPYRFARYCARIIKYKIRS